MCGYDRPSEGLRPLRRVELHLERDRHSRERGTQYKYLEHRHRPCRLDEGELTRECRSNRPGAVTNVTGGSRQFDVRFSPRKRTYAAPQQSADYLIIDY
jgi:hypothetical protein